jgi:hypothetical protein
MEMLFFTTGYVIKDKIGKYDVQDESATIRQYCV